MIEIIEIKSTAEEKTLASYLFREVGAWEKKSKIYVPLLAGIRYFKTLTNFKSFVTHTSNGKITLKKKHLNLDKLTTLQFEEIIRGGEALEDRGIHYVTK